MAYQALFWRVELGRVSLQVRVLLIRGGEEERRVLARCNTGKTYQNQYRRHIKE
jgi:hypothetical protein